MKRNSISILMVAAILFGLLAGCGGGSASAASSAAASQFPASVGEKASDAAPSGSEYEEASVASQIDETVTRHISLPITEEPVTYTYWLCYAPFAADLVNTDTMEGILVLDTIQELSNIHFDITAANGAAEQDNFNLMIASGDYADILFAMGYYGTGLEGAVDEGIIQDLADVLPEKCPSYWAQLSADTNTLMEAYTDSGYMPTICALTPVAGQEAIGPIVRKDWLDEFGMELPKTYEDLHKYLKTALDEKNAILDVASTDGLITDLGYGQNLNLGGYEVVNGKVEFSLVQDSARAYFSFMQQLYQEGIISQDFFSSSNEDLNYKARANFGSGANSLVSTSAGLTSDIMANVTDAEFEMAVLPYVSQSGTEEVHVGSDSLMGRMKDNDAWAFSTSCKDIDPLLDLVEYLYSDDAYLLTNYGVENVSYTLDENGEPHYTDLIINNPDGLSYFFASYVYATNGGWAFLPFLNDLSRTFYDFNDNQWEVYDTLQTLSDCSQNYPPYASLTTEESEKYASIESDLSTYADSEILAFITGAANLESDFDTFVDTMYDMGLQDLIDLKQAAYDRAEARVAEFS